MLVECECAADVEALAEALRSHFEALGIGVNATQTAASLREQSLAFCNIIVTFLLSMALLLALVGGLGLAPSANVGERGLVAEPVHGSAPDIAGQGVANPLACIAAAALLLAHLGEPDAARGIEAAVDATLAARVWTPDLGGSATTEAVTRAVIGAMTPLPDRHL